MPKPAQKDNKTKQIIYSLGIITAAAFIILVFFSKMARAAIFITGFIVLNMVLSSYKRFFKVPIELEFLTLGIVLCTIKFGIKAGLIVAVLGGILSFIVSLNLSPFAFPMLLGYASIAVISYLLRGFDIIVAGIAAALFNNIMVFMIFHFGFSYDIIPNLSFSVSNIIFNIIFFINIAPFVLALMF